MTKEELLDLIEAYEIFIGLYERDKKKNKVHKVKKIKEIKSQKNISIKILCLIANIAYSTFFKYCDKNTFVDKCYTQIQKQIVKKIREIYFKNNKILNIRKIY